MNKQLIKRLENAPRFGADFVKEWEDWVWVGDLHAEAITEIHSLERELDYYRENRISRKILILLENFWYGLSDIGDSVIDFGNKNVLDILLTKIW